MFTEKMAQLTSEFTSRILETLRTASLEELTLRAKPRKAATPRKGAPKRRIAAKAAPREGGERMPDRERTADALSFFTERGSKGATAQQLSAHLQELGFAPTTDVVEELASNGAIRDAGFRRSTGTGNKTAPVYVRAA